MILPHFYQSLCNLTLLTSTRYIGRLEDLPYYSKRLSAKGFIKAELGFENGLAPALQKRG